MSRIYSIDIFPSLIALFDNIESSKGACNMKRTDCLFYDSFDIRDCDDIVEPILE